MRWFVRFLRFVRYGDWRKLNHDQRKFKKGRGLMSRPRPEQDPQRAMATHDEMRAAGAKIAMAVGIEAALAQLEIRGLLRGRAQ
jgi:hypothetical protein